MSIDNTNDAADDTHDPAIDDVTIDDPINSIGVNVPFNVFRGPEIGVDQARRLLNERITELRKAGVVTLTMPDLSELITSGFRSRAWVRKELLRLCNEDTLIDLGEGRFGIHHPDRDTGAPALQWSARPDDTPDYNVTQIGDDLLRAVVAGRMSVMAELRIFLVSVQTFVDLIRAGVRPRAWFEAELDHRASTGQIIPREEGRYLIRRSQLPDGQRVSVEVHGMQLALMTARRDELDPIDLSPHATTAAERQAAVDAALVDRQDAIADLETALLRRLLEEAGSWNCGGPR
jgi:hypothetical protein